MTHSPSPINGIIFDLDGTLINTLSAIGKAFNLALAEQGWDQHPLDRFATFIGSGARVAASRALPEVARVDDAIDRLVARQREIHETIWKDEVTVYKGIPELLDYLAKKDIPSAVLTNKDEPAAVACLAHCFPDHHFQTVQGRREGVALKPDPTSANRIIDDLGLPSGEIAMLGDTEVDLQTAAAAGMLGVAVSWGFRTVNVLLETGCDILLEDPLALIERLS